MPRPPLVVPLLAVIMGFGIAHARAEDAPAPVDAARLNERYAITPGTEALFGEMLGKGETLPGGCTLSDGQIERTAVVATYTCGDAQVVVQLLHPAIAPSGGVRTDRFAISPKSGTPPAGLLEAVAAHVRAHEAGFQWTELGDQRAEGALATQRRWLRLLGGGAVVAIVLYWALRRRR